jgi:hypothetical protein
VPAIAERLPAKYLVKAEAGLVSTTKPIFRGFWNCNAKHIEARKKQKRPNCWSS